LSAFENQLSEKAQLVYSIHCSLQRNGNSAVGVVTKLQPRG